jgi:hypothetical protein
MPQNVESVMGGGTFAMANYVRLGLAHGLVVEWSCDVGGRRGTGESYRLSCQSGGAERDGVVVVLA